VHRLLVITITLILTTILRALQNIHCTPDTLDRTLVYGWVTMKREGRDPVTNGCATGQEIREGTPIATTQIDTDDRDGTEPGEDILENVGFGNLWFYELHGQLHPPKVQMSQVAHPDA
jgi:hypothetical protein